MTSALLLEFLVEIAGKCTLSVTLVVYSASRRRSSEVTPQKKALEPQGIKLHLFPSYNPELNRIEKLWQQMKYIWMDVKSRTIDILNQDVSHILDNFDTEFKLAFQCI